MGKSKPNYEYIGEWNMPGPDIMLDIAKILVANDIPYKATLYVKEIKNNSETYLLACQGIEHIWFYYHISPKKLTVSKEILNDDDIDPPYISEID